MMVSACLSNVSAQSSRIFARALKLEDAGARAVVSTDATEPKPRR